MMVDAKDLEARTNRERKSEREGNERKERV